MLRAVFNALAVVALVAGLTACGDKSTGADLRPEGASPPPVNAKPGASSDSVQGYVINGSVTGAQVTIFEISGSTILFDTPLVSGVTNADGFYQLMLDDIHLGKPALILVESMNDGSTTMRCDLRNGCGAAEFGEVYTFENDTLNLKLISPGLEKGRFHNVSVFSSIAAARFEEKLNQNFAQKELKTLAAKTNAETVNRFGLFGSLTEIDLISLSGAIAEQPTLTLRHSLLQMGLIEAQRVNDPQAAVGELLSDIVSNVSEGIADVSSGGGLSVDMRRVLAEAQNVIRDIGLDAHPKATFVSSEFAAEMASMERVGANVTDVGAVSDTLFSEPIDQGKSIVSEIRQIGGSLDLPALSTLSDIGLETVIDIENSGLYTQFIGRSAAIELTNRMSVDRSIDAFLEVLEAVLSVIADEAENGVKPVGVDNIINSENGVTLSYIRTSENVRVFRVRQSINVCEPNNIDDQQLCSVLVDLELVLDSVISVAKELNANIFDVDFDLNALTLAGSFDVGNMRVSLLPGTELQAQMLSLEFEDTESNIFNGKESVLALFLNTRGFDFVLSVQYGLLTGEPQNMRQEYRIQADSLLARYEDITESDLVNLIDSSTVSWLIGSAKHLTATIGGLVTDGAGNRSSYAINVTADGQDDVFSFKTRTVSTCSVDDAGKVCDEQEVELSEEELGEFSETDDRFLPASYHFIFDADFSGISDTVKATLGGRRMSKDDNSLVVTARYPGHHVTMEGEIDILNQIQTLDAINQDGSRLFISKPNGKDRDGSVVSASGEVIAPIIDMGEWLKIPFADGFFQSL